jgi:sulfite reductase (NADPH) hemoprotein beta-component
VPDVIEAVLDTYRACASAGEFFIDTLRRIGHDPSSTAANGARRPKQSPPAEAITRLNPRSL